MTVIARPDSGRPPAGAAPVAPWGLLSRVHRPCPDHGGDGRCVARHEAERCLVYWCARGEHHFTARPAA